jgi:glutamate racemase
MVVFLCIFAPWQLNTRFMDTSPIGIFDSGVGGLTVASAVRRLLPEETIIYYGDTAHLPYGDKSAEAILYYSKKITDFLLKWDCKIILAACNTVSATVWDELCTYTGTRSIPVNVIDPVVSRITGLHRGSNFGIIGTKNTIGSNAYPDKIKRLDPLAKVASMATPLLVPMIEEGFVNDEISNAIIKTYLSDEKLSNTEVLVLGCTHYPIIRDQIISYYNGRVEVVDSAMIVASHVRDLIRAGSDAGSVPGKGRASADRFFVSDYTEYFEKIAGRFFRDDITIEKVDLWR